MWATISNEITALFNGMGYIPMIALFVGLVLLIVEIFVPGFGIFGIIGAIFSIVGIAVRMIIGGTVIQLLIMLTFAIVIVIIAFIIVVILARCGVLRMGLVQNKTAIPGNFAKPNKQYAKLIGKVGFATTAFRPVGAFSYKEKTYDAISTGEFIDKNSKVVVVDVKGDEIYVKKA